MVLAEPASSGVSGEPATLDPTALFLASESSSLSSFGDSDSSFESELLSFESELESSSLFVELSDPPGFMSDSPGFISDPPVFLSDPPGFISDPPGFISEVASDFLSLDLFESPFLSFDEPSAFLSFDLFASPFLSVDLFASPFLSPFLSVDLPDSPVFPDLEAELSPDDFLEAESSPDYFLESAASLAPLDDDAAAASLPAFFLSLDESPPADELSLEELSLEELSLDELSFDELSAGFYLIISPPPSPPSEFGSSYFFDESFPELEALSEVVTFDSFVTFLVSEPDFVTFFAVASSPWAKL